MRHEPFPQPDDPGATTMRRTPATAARPRATARPPMGRGAVAGDAPRVAAPSPDDTAPHVAVAARRYAPAANAYSQPYEDAGDGRGPRPSRGTRTRRPARHGCLSALLWLVVLAVVALMAIRCLPSHMSAGNMVPELVSFVPLAIPPVLLCMVLAVLWRRRVLAVACAVVLAVIGAWHSGYVVGDAKVSDAARVAVQTKADTSDRFARVMTLNTAHGEASAVDIVRICREQHVEVLCLQELPPNMLEDLEHAGIDDLFPHHVVSEGATYISNGGRNGIWTMAPMDSVSENLLPIKTSSMPAANITVGSRTVRVVTVHPNSPVRGAQDLWDEGLSTIQSLKEYDHAYLIMGDFNSTWDHARFRDLLGTSFCDAGESSGQGPHMTYPSGGWVPSLIEIDHIVYSRDSGIVVSDLQTVSVRGSDHKALLGTLETL